MRIDKPDYNHILQQNKGAFDEHLQQLCDRLLAAFPSFSWVGFYFMNHQHKVLHLGPFAGPPTDHVTIPFGKGICGQVASTGKTYLSQDVSAEDNYLACSVDVKAELVVPIYVAGELVAQLDIDSTKKASFTQEIEAFVTEICSRLTTARATELTHLQRSLITKFEAH